MKIKEGFSLRRVGDENIVIATGAQHVDFHRVISFNESAARLWKTLHKRTFSTDDAAQLLMQWYEVDADTAAQDAQAILQGWTAAGLTY